MLISGKEYRTVWMEGGTVFMIDQNELPFDFRVIQLDNYRDTCRAIRNMTVRGAGAIGASAGFAMAQAFLQAPNRGRETFCTNARYEIESTRPTARNLFYAVERVFNAGMISAEKAVIIAQDIADADAEDSRNIGVYGSKLIVNGMNICTHCNAGWLAFVDHGTALSPVYHAHSTGKKVFVYVDETRPRGQGARLTAWELYQAGIPHVIIPDNATASLMSQGKIDMMIVGADRIALNGDVANKIGTLEKAIVASKYKVPFYVAAPTTTIDIACASGREIVIEERDEKEVLYQKGIDKEGKACEIMVASPGSPALNPAFDVTPADLITGLITEKGIVKAVEKEISALFV
ncbi:MAG TPA: S-methyl-5-thioribose-1-phosphate isomerase [Bacteroidales bacterium]|nr:S-methyl-5-thioribose-1-phosphate isomerase [Bacteroidales bacterium]